MKDGYIITKSAEIIDEADLAKINSFSRRKLKAEELYVFSVILCDNEIDRDGERFSINALEKLAKMFLGKTGIFDHSMKSSDQTARIFKAQVEKDESKTTKAGEVYHCLKAKAYMPRTVKNSDLIMEIDSGIKKEVSVGCSVANIQCSVCKKDTRHSACEHIKGKTYRTDQGEMVAHVILDHPTDAYEWSFVAVPAQPGAGVVKAFKAKGKDEIKTFETLRQAVKRIKTARNEITLTKAEADMLSAHIDDLTELADAGKEYRTELSKEMLKFWGVAEPDFDLELMKNVADRMTLRELKSFRQLFERKAESSIPKTLQLGGKQNKSSRKNNQGFLI